MYAQKNNQGVYFISYEIDNYLISLGYKKLHKGTIPNDYNAMTMELKEEIIDREDGDYEYKYTAVVSKAKIEQSISLLKQQLADTDYKVVKNMEALQCGLELPYEPNALHNERQAIRDKINELEELLK